MGLNEPSVRQRTDAGLCAKDNYQMNRDRIEGKLKQFNAKLLEYWAVLMSDRKSVIAARRQQRAGRLQELHGIEQAQSRRQMQEFQRRNRHWDTSTH